MQTRDEQRAYSVRRLAEIWDCTPKHIYKLIERGELRAFSIGKRGLRITVAEADRWERESVKSYTETETSSSEDEKTGGLPTYAMKALASV